MYPPSIIAEAAANGLLTGGRSTPWSRSALRWSTAYSTSSTSPMARCSPAPCSPSGVSPPASGSSPYLSPSSPSSPVFFALGYALQRFVIGPASRGRDGNVLLVTLGLAIIIQNGFARRVLTPITRSLDDPAAFDVVPLGPDAALYRPRLIGFAVAARGGGPAALAPPHPHRYRPRHPRRRPRGSRRPPRRHRRASTSSASPSASAAPALAVAAGLLDAELHPQSPASGEAFVLVAFTIVVLGGMGSVRRRPDRRPPDRRRRKPQRPLPRRQPRPNRHFRQFSSSCCCFKPAGLFGARA